LSVSSLGEPLAQG